MDKRQLRHIYMLLGACLAAVASGYLLCRADPIGPAGYARIQLGMSSAEVEAALAIAAGDYYTRHARYGINSGPFVTLLRESGVPAKDLPNGGFGETRDGRLQVSMQTWCGNLYCIWVVFGEDGKAVETYLSRLEHIRDSRLTVFLDDLRVQLGW